jgi:hypothetical protein
MIKKAYFFSIILCSLFLSGCSSSQSENSQDAEFLSAAEEFLLAFNNKDVAEIDKYIDKDYGAFVIYNPGAFVVSKHIYSFAEITSMEGTYDAANLKVTKINCANPRSGLEPVYSCDMPEGWNKQGCFYGTEKTIELHKLYTDMVTYELMSENTAAEPMRKASLSENNHKFFLYNTDETIGFHFGKRNGNIYLIAIDRVIPCSA